jgi:hypothetical protein
VGQERLGPSYFFISLVLGPLNRLVWWEVPLRYIALRSFSFLQEQIKDIIITIRGQYYQGMRDGRRGTHDGGGTTASALQPLH